MLVLAEINQLELVQYRVARFITYRQQNAPNVGDVLQHLNWHSLENGHKDAQLLMMYKIVNKNVAITEPDRLKSPWRQ